MKQFTFLDMIRPDYTITITSENKVSSVSSSFLSLLQINDFMLNTSLDNMLHQISNNNKASTVYDITKLKSKRQIGVLLLQTSYTNLQNRGTLLLLVRYNHIDSTYELFNLLKICNCFLEFFTPDLWASITRVMMSNVNNFTEKHLYSAYESFESLFTLTKSTYTIIPKKIKLDLGELLYIFSPNNDQLNPTTGRNILEYGINRSKNTIISNNINIKKLNILASNVLLHNYFSIIIY